MAWGRLGCGRLLRISRRVDWNWLGVSGLGFMTANLLRNSFKGLRRMVELRGKGRGIEGVGVSEVVAQFLKC